MADEDDKMRSAEVGVIKKNSSTPEKGADGANVQGGAGGAVRQAGLKQQAGEEGDIKRAEPEKEPKIRKVALAYYSRKDVQKAIYEFCLKRETIPRYMEGFGKRPNNLEYPSDILALARNGATSFHCSEERWKNVLEIGTDKSADEMNELREGFDLLIDIDSKYFDYSKKAAMAVIKVLERYGVKNIGVKFSGNRGWHIIVPWEAFPKEVNEIETNTRFPEIPRAILGYITEQAKPILESSLEGDESLKKVARGIRCEKCKNIASEFYLVTISCPMKNCRRTEQTRKPVSGVSGANEADESKTEKTRKRRCLECSSAMEEISREKLYFCQNCKIDSKKSPDNFSQTPTYDIYEQLGLDIILVSPRHLFRTPYSLHEKTALASVVIDSSALASFSHKDADPIGIIIKPFLPQTKPDEAKYLLIQSLDWAAKNKIDKSIGKGSLRNNIEPDNEEKQFKEIIIDRSKLTYPPSIEAILKGMEGDGRKRALFILVNYFSSLNFTEEEVSKLIEEWNRKNKKPLREGYIKSQLEWTFRQISHDASSSGKSRKILPPNYDKPYYKGIGIHPTEEELKYKNPINYTIKKMFAKKQTSSRAKWKAEEE